MPGWAANARRSGGTSRCHSHGGRAAPACRVWVDVALAQGRCSPRHRPFLLPQVRVRGAGNAAGECHAPGGVAGSGAPATRWPSPRARLWAADDRAADDRAASARVRPALRGGRPRPPPNVASSPETCGQPMARAAALQRIHWRGGRRRWSGLAVGAAWRCSTAAAPCRRIQSACPTAEQHLRGWLGVLMTAPAAARSHARTPTRCCFLPLLPRRLRTRPSPWPSPSEPLAGEAGCSSCVWKAAG